MILAMTRQYELMLVLSTSGDYESEKKREEVVKKLLGETAAVDSLTLLGKKTLAYPIKKQTEGVYLVAAISGPAIIVGDIEKKTAQMTEVLRYLLLSKN
ncbi:30S ribosomal protein S6 [Candidatus Gottesmanbacteria bacterium]|nr:30S ribosomal protein S6 [Candidatus Gottesmanbacteria bacterium]